MSDIRPYLSADETACLSVLASNTPKYFDPGDDVDFRRFLTGTNRGDYFVARVGGVIRACGGCYVTESGIAGLSWGMVHADEHRRGLGSEMLRYRLDVIRKVPYAWCVLLNTTQLVAPFFERFGFRTFRVIPDAFGPGLDKYAMRLLWVTG